MKTKFGYRLIGKDLQIFREKTLVAVYDTETKEIAYEPGKSSLALTVKATVDRFLKENAAKEPSVEEPPAEAPPEENPPAKKKTAAKKTAKKTAKVSDKEKLEVAEREIADLKNSVKGLSYENQLLRLTIKDRKERTVPQHPLSACPDRYEDEFDDSEAPVQDPALGDMTPEYLTWAKKNMPVKVFEKRYGGRL